MVIDDAGPDPGAPPSELPCQNCGDATPGQYCRMCGQKKTLYGGSLRVLIQDALDDQLSIVAAMPRTARGLYFHPGFLTQEYAAGRIVRYIRPLRLYLLVSVLFFLVLSILGPAKQIVKVNRGTQKQTSPAALVTDSSADMLHTGISFIDTRFNNNMRKLDSIDAQSAAQFFNRGVVQRGPTVMFLLLPLYALLLTVLYWRSRVHYAQHFVYSLHVHSFAFSILTLMLLVPNGRIGVAINVLLLAWMVVYGFLAQRRVYRQGWLITGVKYVSVGVIYMVAWAFGLLLSIMIAVTLM